MRKEMNRVITNKPCFNGASIDTVVNANTLETFLRPTK